MSTLSPYFDQESSNFPQGGQNSLPYLFQGALSTLDTPLPCNAQGGLILPQGGHRLLPYLFQGALSMLDTFLHCPPQGAQSLPRGALILPFWGVIIRFLIPFGRP